MASNETRPIFCGVCETEAKARVDADGEVQVVCPTCGREDRFKEAVQAAVEHAMRQLLDGSLGRVTTGSNDFVKITIKRSPQSESRWFFKDLLDQG